MSVEILTKSDLMSFQDSILETIKGLIKTHNSPNEWLKSSEVRKILKCSNGTLQKFRNNEKLPFKRILGTIYYDRKDVNKLFTENE